MTQAEARQGVDERARETQERGGDAERRAAAFRAAERHSARVRALRRGIFAVAALAVLAFVGTLFWAPSRSAPAVSLGAIGVEGTRVTMSAPKLNGYRNDSRPYQVTARTATQDLKTPQLIDLADLDARIGMGEQGTGHVVAKTGRYDSARETLHLADDVTMRTDRGYELRLASADIDFKAGSLVSDQPVEALLRGSQVRAGSLLVEDGGRKLVFAGRVRSILRPQGATAPDAPSAAAAIEPQQKGATP